MAQYYNIMNAGSALTIEDVQRMCSVEGQSVHFVLEDSVNGANGSPQLVTYTAATQNTDQTVFSPQTINLSGQIATNHSDQRQNVYIIKTNDIATPHVIKSNVNTQLVGENIVNIIENQGPAKIPVNSSPQGQNLQWIKMQENNINYDMLVKQNTITPIKNQICNTTRNQQSTNITHQVSLQSQGQRSQLETPTYPQVERKPPVRLYQNKNRQSVNNIQPAATTSTSQQLGCATNPPDDRLHSLNVVNNRNTNTIFRSKPFGTATGSEVIPTPTRQARSIASPETPHPRNLLPLPMPKNSLVRHIPEVEYLSEKIKQAKLKQLQKPQMAVSPQFQKEILQQNQQQRHQPISPNVVPQERRLLPASSQQQRQKSLNSPAQRQPLLGNGGQQRQPSIALTPQQQAQLQRQPMMMTPQQRQQHQTQATPLQQDMDVDCADNSQEGEKMKSQSCGSQTDNESGFSQSVAYLQKIIHNPNSCVVQRQIEGNTAKMLVVLPNGEQRLITFDIPNEDCTVQDLLEQANIPFGRSTHVALVTDPTLQINYFVQAESGSSTPAYMADAGEQSDSNASQDKPLYSPGSPSAFSPAEENSNSSAAQHEEPKYIDGKLAVCPHCGISSLDFHRCERCKRPMPEDVKAIPMQKPDTFYKKNNEQNRSAKMDRDGSVVSKRGRGRGRTQAKARPIKEPECLTISSDEEDQAEGKSKKYDVENSNAILGNIGNTCSQAATETILEKEPVITNNSISSISDRGINMEEGIKGGGKEREPPFVADGSIQAPHTSLICRTVRIGSYKYIPQERIIISQSGVKLGVPLLEDDTNFVPLEVKFKDVVKVLIHFGKAMPVLFFYTTTNLGSMIRELLGMQDPKGPYYDPAGKDHTHKRITLIPELLTDEEKAILKALFAPTDLLEELSAKEANDILVRASPKDSWQLQGIGTKGGLNTSTSGNISNGKIRTIMVYPPPPAKGGIAINTEDYACLGEDQFLNDVIIDFYLKYLTLEVLSEIDQNRTHVFSSYFYKRLTSPHAAAVESSTPLSPAAKRHARVQKWTKNVNIFEKDFIVIPINEHAHWFLAIICFPGFVGKVPVSPPVANEQDIKKTVLKSKKAKDLKLQAVTIGNTTITPVTTTITLDPGDEGSERDEAEGDDEEMEMDSDEEEETEGGDDSKKVPTKPSLPTPVKEEIVKLPCILIFDSLAGASRSRVVATLRDYLSCEYYAKLGTEQVFSKDTIKGASPKVPQQTNFTDCGVYLLQYVESFFSNPIKDYTLPIKTLKQWFEEIVVTRKREELSKLLVRLMNATKGNKNILLPVLTFPTYEGKLLPKPDSHVELKPVKSEHDSKKKSVTEAENQTSVTTTSATSISSEENTEASGEVVGRTYQIVSHSPASSSSSTENTQTEMFTDTKTPNRSVSDTMSYLKAKRIPRLMQRTSETQDDKQVAKKHKGDSFDSCK